MAKLTLSDPANLQNESTFITTIATNNAAIETAMENTLSRDGTTPNTMSASLDMNSNRIINLPDPVDDNDAARLVDIGDAPTYAAEAEASATEAAASAAAAVVSQAAAAASQSAAATSATSAASSATSASTSATTSAANASIVVGNEYAFDTTTSMADPGTGDVRLDNATLASVTNVAISALTNDTGNPDIRTFIAAWDDSTNTNKGTLYIRELGSPANFFIATVSGTITDNTTWLQIPVTHVTSSGSFAAADRLSVQFVRAGDKGVDGTVAGPGVSVDNEIALWSGTGGATLKRASTTGILKATSGVIAAAVSATDYAPATTGTSILKASSGGFANAVAGTDYQSPIGTISGIAKGNGANALTAAVSGTDYCAATSGSSVLKGSSGNTTAATAGTDYVAPGTATAFSAQQYFTLATLTDGANISWTVSSGQKAKVTLGGNRTMNAVTGAVEGATYTLWIIQDGTGSRTMSWTTSGAGAFDFGTAGAPTLTTTASKADVLTFEAISIGGTLKLRYTGIARGYT